MPIHGIRATYQPFSFQERLAPLQMMKEEYDKINEGISTLGEASNQYYQFLDPETKKVIDQYNATLQQVAGDMSANGMKAVSRNTLNALRRQYSSQILPIQQAAQTYGTMQAQVNEMAMKDPTLMVQSMPTVRDIMADPSARPHVISGSQLEKEGMAAALQLPGVDYSAISRYLNGDTSAIPGLGASVQQIAQTYGVSDEQALGYISRGIISGLGQRATSLYDAEQKQRIEEESRMRILRFQTGQQAYLDNLRTANNIKELESRAALQGKSGSGASSSGSTRGSGTAYNRQMDGTVYVRGDQEYAYDGSFGTAQKDEAVAAEKKSKAKGTSVYKLSDKNKIIALSYIGVNVSDTISSYELNRLIKENESALLDYTYKEYVNEKKPKENEFKMSPKKIKRDVGVEEDDYYEGEDENLTVD